jgi:hypothetical protein
MPVSLARLAHAPCLAPPPVTPSGFVAFDGLAADTCTQTEAPPLTFTDDATFIGSAGPHRPAGRVRRRPGRRAIPATVQPLG